MLWQYARTAICPDIAVASGKANGSHLHSGPSTSRRKDNGANREEDLWKLWHLEINVGRLPGDEDAAFGDGFDMWGLGSESCVESRIGEVNG